MEEGHDQRQACLDYAAALTHRRSVSLSHADLKGLALPGKNLDDIVLRGCTLSGSNLRGISMRGASLEGCVLDRCGLVAADLTNSIFRDCTFKSSDLSGANLTDTEISGCDLSRARLCEAEFANALLRGTNLFGADLSGATGLLDPTDWMERFFKKDRKGYIVYRACHPDGAFNKPPSRWTFAPGVVLIEEVNPDRTQSCACGVNFGTVHWCYYNLSSEMQHHVWRWRLPFKWLSGLVVPYDADGKARCSRLELLEPLSKDDFLDLAIPNRHDRAPA